MPYRLLYVISEAISICILSLILRNEILGPRDATDTDKLYYIAIIRLYSIRLI
jgi:hypothetical protein